MGRVLLIEPAVGLYAFAMFMIYPLLQQYVYRRLWFELSGTTYPAESLSHCSNNHSYVTIHQAVQKETSIFLFKSELCFLIPSLISALLLVSYSDYCGRKVAIVPPLVGDTLFALCYALVSRFSFSLNYLLAASFLSGLMGGPTTLIGGCFAYVADLCGEDLEGQKTVRMARLDMILGVLTGLASLCTGFYIKAAGFTWPFLTAAFLHLVNLFYVLVVLKESLVLPNPSLSSSGASEAPRLSQSQALTVRLQGVYLLFAASKRRRNIVLLLMLAAFAFFRVIMIILALFTRSICLWYIRSHSEVLLVAPNGKTHLRNNGCFQTSYIDNIENISTSIKRSSFELSLLYHYCPSQVALQGGMSIFILYELNTPLCWSEVFVGYGSALSTAIYLVSFAGVTLLSRYLPEPYIILLGLMSVAAGLIMAAFAKSTLLMFLVRLPLLLSIMPTPVLRSMMSKIVSGSEQGAMFACVAFVEMLSVGVAFTMFSSIYAATLSWFSGFSFLLAAGLTLIPATLICVILCLRLDVYEESIILTEEMMENHPGILELPP
ncbi:solute carrier family 46 member 3 isoform X1 [Carassius gibelio]|uniref:solute carrier family 46 member 3 isoform X1 n=1 Tax=Carassius gibelio TaxID=101364 RepID=UPI002277CAC9|nr:solute carrier family 46 member 3 isoform X1 [Carassius gibelio]